MQSWLTDTANSVDAGYPDNRAVVINELGEPVLKRQKSSEVSSSVKALESAIAKRMPERNLIDVLRNVDYWTNFTRHFGPISGSDPKLERATERYLLTTFTYGCNLGPTQAARHIMYDKHRITEEPYDAKVSSTVLESNGSRERVVDFNLAIYHQTLIMELYLDCHVKYSCSDDFKITEFHSSIKTYHEDEELVEIGYILAYRLDLAYEYSDLLITADCLGEDLSRFSEFFLLDNEDDLLPNYWFYIDRVLIKPEYRGYDYGLQALAVFLELFAKGEAVGCHPSPTQDLSDKYSQSKGQLLMKRYWSKLGLKNYDEEKNILWARLWELPSWLNAKIFED